MLAQHDSGAIDTETAVDLAVHALSVGKSTALVMQLNAYLPANLRLNTLQVMMKKNKPKPAASAAAPKASPAASPPSVAPAAASPPAAPTAAADPDDMLAHLTEPGWRAALSREFEKPYFKRIADHVTKERRSKKIFPPTAEVFNAFNYTPFADVKVVIIGQDPYHGPGQAHGLCFSVAKGVTVPPSLKNSKPSSHRAQRRPVHSLSTCARACSDLAPCLCVVVLTNAATASCHVHACCALSVARALSLSVCVCSVQGACG